ncbi:MAG: saccharopine dehydrogenase C-terminal domain-containing protein [Sulfolobales archaeon]
MKALGLAGLGRVGLRSLKILTRYMRGLELIVFDRDPSRLELLRDFENTRFIPVKDVNEIARHLSEIDLLMIALPSREAYKLLRSAASRCVDIIDVSYQQSDPYDLERTFLDCGRIYIPDAGYAPGYSNLLAGYAQNIVESLESLEIYVGGIPSRNIPPIGYTITWSAEDLLEEYMRPAKIVRDGSIIEVDPLEQIGFIEIEGLGSLEWFYSDGLHTMLRNIKARNMFEATLRWPGHIETFRILKNLGFLDRERISIGGEEIEIYRITAEILERRLRINAEDIAILLVRARGSRGLYEEFIMMRGKPEDPATTRFTSIVFASTTLLVARERSRFRSGVHPLEDLYTYKDYFERMLLENQPEKDLISIVKRRI